MPYRHFRDHRAISQLASDMFENRAILKNSRAGRFDSPGRFRRKTDANKACFFASRREVTTLTTLLELAPERLLLQRER